MEKIYNIDSLYDQQITEIWDLLKDGWRVKMIVPVNYGGQSKESGGAFLVLEK